MRTPLLALLLACTDKDGEDSPSYQPDCAKVLCAADEYCLSTSGGASQDTALPECTPAPASCGGTPTCDCLPECTSCTTDGTLVRCSIAYP